ncbi:type VII secretion AAA-ATPase EccA [Mycolicibacterium fortuitum]|jgi:type VII secretion ATPase EccA|uniref:AAA family ATPase n=3 Tax=Mycolicibacterium TaxID=1866885 RepID=A0A0N9XYW9_MYCFO|nr:type VII secretion AAA-ATPase EccA [Mycolicibacterium fortuitum]CRL72159.1 ATPase central domain-containing protein [Mycolicibacter nonchromogenicus]ALI29355.1 AAA family ATPase [Mycolicibacterium fortuitum]EJZ09105.1 ESX-1 secretion system protein EccA1 [Mycolicibacterium fortuitum subsp. fortuitum DSM 46621 = ATCC 6841 = JCM 6387]MCA4722467.1 type VII secretion AAA-ATPase EccA [Mycolicibacterium fortuitum]MDG5774635.1 type VII secretion AAA-ATPase EccA [Mycolicibacterium fortuitum]
MSGSTDAQRVFDAGVLSLGIPIDGLETERDLPYAALAFRRATEYDPDMCDAWLGRAATGDTSPEVIYHLYRTSTLSLFREQRRLGLPQRALSGRFQTGLYLDYPLSTKTEMWLAYAASMIAAKDFDEAEQVLDKLAQTTTAADGDTAEICAYIRGVLHFTTQRWPDVLTALSKSGSFTDSYISAGADLMVGSACAQMGLFGEGIRRLDRAIAGPVPGARRAAEFCKGLTLREMGEEQEARVIFERIYSEDPGFEANAAALADPKYRLVITSKEVVDSRTDRWDPASVPSAEDLLADDLSERGNEYLQAAQQELERQIGLSEVKLQVAKLKSAAMLAKVRGDKGLSSAARSLHLAFTGPPGTGKTTIARVVAQTYCGLGLLRTPNIVEAKRHDFVGQHLGSTAIKTTALIDSAMDGVLFIDEAYTLIQTGLSGGDAFGREAVDTLLARMENDRDRLVVIIAGYDAEIDRFLASNDGLASRFTKRIRFGSYGPHELGDIGKLVARTRDSELSEAAYEELVAACTTLCQSEALDSTGQLRPGIDLAGNGRFVRNVIEAAEEEREYRLSEIHGMNLSDLDEAQLMRIESVDMRAALKQVLGMTASS